MVLSRSKEQGSPVSVSRQSTLANGSEARMMFSSHFRPSVLGASGIVATIWLTAGSAQACLNTNTSEPCHCIETMMLTHALGSPPISTPSLTGNSAITTAQPASNSFNLFAGDHTGFNYYSQGSGNTGGSGSITIAVGDTVTWTMDQGTHAAHTITSLPGDPEAFDSGFLFSPGDTFSHTFLTPGSYTYYCSNHAGYNLINGMAVPFGSQVATITVVAVPEPSVMAIAGIGGCVGLLRRRRVTKLN